MPLFGYTNTPKSFCQPILKGNIKGAMKGEIEAFKMTIWGDMVVAIATVGYSFKPKGKNCPYVFPSNAVYFVREKEKRTEDASSFQQNLKQVLTKH